VGYFCAVAATSQDTIALLDRVPVFSALSDEAWRE
jgi:hypothetical protein